MEEKMLEELKNINLGIKDIKQTMNQKFEEIDIRFEQIDKRFEQIDKRFEQIDQKFEEIDRRFEEITEMFKKDMETMERRIYKDISEQIKFLCESIERVEDGKHEKIEEKTLKGVEAFRDVLVG